MRWLRRVAQEAAEQAAEKSAKQFRKDLAKLGELSNLREEIETLKLERDRKLEEFDRREREVEHKVGLERKRQEFEIDQAKRETKVSIRQENLKADRKRFEEQMEFHEKRFVEEVKYLKDMVDQVLQRLPSASIYAEVGTASKDK